MPMEQLSSTTLLRGISAVNGVVFAMVLWTVAGASGQELLQDETNEGTGDGGWVQICRCIERDPQTNICTRYEKAGCQPLQEPTCGANCV